jgi:hypothetical protein
MKIRLEWYHIVLFPLYLLGYVFEVIVEVIKDGYENAYWRNI